MAARSFQIALTAGATRLSDVYGDGPSVLNPKNDVPYRLIQFLATTAPAFIGGSDMSGLGATPVSSATYGAKADSASNLPIVLGTWETGPVKLSDFWASGANAILHILAIPY